MRLYNSLPVLFLTLLILAACGKEEKKQEDLASYLPGVWEVSLLQVTVNSAQNDPDSSYVFEANKDNWVDQFQVKPFRTFYESDNKYRIEYRTVYDSLLNMSRGIYNVFGDTLMRIEPNGTYQYIVKRPQPGIMEYRSTIDWDGDGNEDDDYLEVQRFLKL